MYSETPRRLTLVQCSKPVRQNLFEGKSRQQRLDQRIDYARCVELHLAALSRKKRIEHCSQIVLDDLRNGASQSLFYRVPGCQTNGHGANVEEEAVWSHPNKPNRTGSAHCGR
ncbi:hypothetical protein QP185_22405 [Sphingomonas aerolata]